MSKVTRSLPTPYTNHIRLKQDNHTPSLKSKNLSIPEAISYGQRIGNVPTSIMLASEEGAQKLADLHKEQGGIDYDLSTERNGLTKEHLEEIKKYVDYDSLAKKNDTISQLTYKQLTILFKELEKLYNEDTLNKSIGISSDLKEEKEFYVTKRLLPDPLVQAQKGKGSTAWTENENKFFKKLKERKNFQYLKNNLLGVHDIDNFMNPVEDISDTAKDMLHARRHQIEYYLNTLSHEKRIPEEQSFYNTKSLTRYLKPKHETSYDTIAMGSLPQHYKPLDHSFLTNNFSPYENKLDDFRKKSQKLLNDQNYSDLFYQNLKNSFL